MHPTLGIYNTFSKPVSHMPYSLYIPHPWGCTPWVRYCIRLKPYGTDCHAIFITYILLLLNFYKRYKSHTVPARRDCIYIIALPWGHVCKCTSRVCCLEALRRIDRMCRRLLPSNAHALHPWDM